MKIGIVTRPNENKWGGDLKAVAMIRQGLQELGQDVVIGPTAMKLLDVDFLLLANTCIDQRTNYETLKLFEMKYGTFGFHEDCIQFDGPSFGLAHYVARCLGAGLPSDDGMEFEIERLFETPEIIYYHSLAPKKTPLFNYELLKNAAVCIANSPTEARILQRDCPSCHAKVVYLTAGLEENAEEDDAVLKFLGLKRGNYILQVGRIEPRKNQLATILATKDFDIPLLLIATDGYLPDYEALCVAAIKKWRQAHTIILSQTMNPEEAGNLRVVGMPDGKLLPKSWINGAFRHAGVCLHPAFSETPGYIFFEAAMRGTSILATDWCTVKDYFFDQQLGHSCLDGRIQYCLPYQMAAIKRFVEENFGKRFTVKPTHPIFERTPAMVAQEILDSINHR